MPEAAPAAPPAAEPSMTGIPLLETSGGREAFGALDDLATDDGKPSPQPNESPAQPLEVKPEAKPRDEKSGKFVPQDKKPAAKASPAAKPATPKPQIDFDNPPGTIGDLRKHYDALKGEYKTATTDRDSWKSKHDEVTRKLSEPREWPEKKSYEDRLSEREKRIQEYENHIRVTNYAKSEDYKERFEKPYVNAFVAGRNKTASMKVMERKNEDGSVVTQQSRPGRAEDFDDLIKIQDDDSAAEFAVQLWGERAPMVLWHREQTLDRRNAGLQAIDDMGKKGEQWDKQQRELSERNRNEANTMIGNFRNAAIEKYPALFKEVEGDVKGNELLSRGKHLLDRVLQNGKPLADGEEPMTQEELAIAIAAVHNKAAGFDRLVHQLRTTQKELADVKGRLESYEKSTPGAGDGGGKPTTGAVTDEDDPFAQLDKMAKER